MTEFTPALAGRVRTLAVFDEWSALLPWMPYRVLCSWRLRLRSGEFEPGPDRDLMLLQIGDALAAMLDCEPGELPGADPVPDTPADLEPGP